MKSEAGSRPLLARLAPSGTSREHASAAGSNGSSGSNGSNGSNGERRRAARRQQPPRMERTSGVTTSPTSTPAPLIHDDPLSALLDEAQAAVSEGANALRDVRERYRAAWLERVERWEGLRAVAGTATSARHGRARQTQAESDEAMVGKEVGQERSTLGRIDLAVKSLENAWLFLARE